MKNSQGIESEARENKITAWQTADLLNFPCICAMNFLLCLQTTFTLFHVIFFALFKFVYVFPGENIPPRAFSLSHFSLTCNCEAFSQFQVKRCKLRREEKIYERKKVEMQTFSIFLSSGTDEKENLKSFFFHPAVIVE